MPRAPLRWPWTGIHVAHHAHPLGAATRTTQLGWTPPAREYSDTPSLSTRNGYKEWQIWQWYRIVSYPRFVERAKMLGRFAHFQRQWRNYHRDDLVTAMVECTRTCWRGNIYCLRIAVMNRILAWPHSWGWLHRVRAIGQQRLVQSTVYIYCIACITYLHAEEEMSIV